MSILRPPFPHLNDRLYTVCIPGLEDHSCSRIMCKHLTTLGKCNCPEGHIADLFLWILISVESVWLNNTVFLWTGGPQTPLPSPFPTTKYTYVYVSWSKMGTLHQFSLHKRKCTLSGIQGKHSVTTWCALVTSHQLFSHNVNYRVGYHSLTTWYKSVTSQQLSWHNKVHSLILTTWSKLVMSQ